MDAQKPDWGLRIGIGLWIAIGLAVLHFLGPHISSWFWYTVLAIVASRAVQYVLNLTVDTIAKFAQELREIRNRLDNLENIIKKD